MANKSLVNENQLINQTIKTESAEARLIHLGKFVLSNNIADAFYTLNHEYK
jgi:hypothetical protein